MPDAPLPRCGDHVHHLPTGEEWFVAWAEDGEVAPAGWPASIARLSDCTVTYRCTDTQHAAAVEEWSRSGGTHRGRVLRLYGDVLADTAEEPEEWLREVD